MSKAYKKILVVLCVAVILTSAITATIAWLSDTDENHNTFTIGQVHIEVDEAKVNPDGTLVPEAERVKGNNYHLIPGMTYIKDPTMTVKNNSEEAYVRMLVTINCKSEWDAVLNPGVELNTIFNGWDENVWHYYGETIDTANNAITYEFRYKEIVKTENADQALEPLFESITLPGHITAEELKMIKDFTIVVKGHAIQAAGFADEQSAWESFDIQHKGK